MAGAEGEAINALLCTAGHNLRLLVAWLIGLWPALIRLLVSVAEPQPLTATFLIG